MPHHDDEIHDHDRGLAFDLPRLITRRRAVGLFAGGVSAAALAACGSDDNGATTTAATPASTETEGSTTTATTTTTTTTAINEETAGPFPGDGSNGPNVLAESGVVRSDITKSIGDASGTAAGVPTNIELTLIDVAGGGTPLAGAAVYLWHCDRAGAYSMYDGDAASENYLRGVQESDKDGKLTFKSIFPAAYQGRWPHIHFEVYESIDAATSASSKLTTSQLAIPAEICESVYATDGYEQSVQNLSQTSLDTDNVFSDGYAGQLATASGDAGSAVTLKLNVGV